MSYQYVGDHGNMWALSFCILLGNRLMLDQIYSGLCYVCFIDRLLSLTCVITLMSVKRCKLYMSTYEYSSIGGVMVSVLVSDW